MIVKLMKNSWKRLSAVLLISLTATSFAAAGPAAAATSSATRSNTVATTTTHPSPLQRITVGESHYPVTGSIIGGLVYSRVELSLKSPDGKTHNFIGNAGGLFTAGAGALFGDLYTSDLDAVLKNTASISIIATPVYVNINFFDSHSTLLGNLHVGATSTVVGAGGGTGNWQ